MTTILGGLVLGLIGSGHCAAMCGPLVLLANPRATGLRRDAAPPPSRLALHAALYHLGRALTYLLLGAVAGFAGATLARFGLARLLAIAAGVWLLAQAVMAVGLVRSRVSTLPVASMVTRGLGHVGVWMRRHRVQGPVVFGALNGLLPCGLVYAALVAATGLADLRASLTFMAMFALGTTPVLVLISVAGGALVARVPLNVRRAAPVALAIVGVLLIVRGLEPAHVHHDAPAAHAHAR